MVVLAMNKLMDILVAVLLDIQVQIVNKILTNVVAIHASIMAHVLTESIITSVSVYLALMAQHVKVILMIAHLIHAITTALVPIK